MVKRMSLKTLLEKSSKDETFVLHFPSRGFADVATPPIPVSRLRAMGGLDGGNGSTGFMPLLGFAVYKTEQKDGMTHVTLGGMA